MLKHEILYYFSRFHHLNPKKNLRNFFNLNLNHFTLINCSPFQVYDLDNKKYGPIEVCQMYVEVLKDFKASHPDFAGSKFIYAPLRGVDDETFSTYLPIMLKLQRNFPDFIAGFDLVGQEDRGKIFSSDILKIV